MSILQQACIVWLLKKKKRKEENTEDVAGVRCAPQLRTATADLPGLPTPFEAACAHISRDDGPYRLFTVVQPPDLLTPRARHTRTHANHLRRAVARPTVTSLGRARGSLAQDDPSCPPDSSGALRRPTPPARFTHGCIPVNAAPGDTPSWTLRSIPTVTPTLSASSPHADGYALICII